MNKLPNPIYLTHPNIPKPLHGMNPRSILGKDWWDVERRKAYAKNNFRCWACGIHKSDAKYHQWLEGHESYDINYRTGEVKLNEIIALCHACHNFIHSGRLLIMWQQNKFSTEKCIDILDHGFYVLSESNLKSFYVAELTYAYITGSNEPNYDYAESSAAWDDWHLVLNGKKYYSKFKNINEWREHYARRS